MTNCPMGYPQKSTDKDIRYSSYVFKSATTSCLFLTQLISPPNTLNTYPLLDLLRFKSLAYFSSTKPCISNTLYNHALPE